MNGKKMPAKRRGSYNPNTSVTEALKDRAKAKAQLMELRYRIQDAEMHILKMLMQDGALEYFRVDWQKLERHFGGDSGNSY